MKKGLTLIEILITLTILAVLATVSFVGFTGAGKKSRDARRKFDLEQVKMALEHYKNSNGNYPSTDSGFWGTCSNYDSHPDTGPNGWVPNLAPTYLARLPHMLGEGTKISNDFAGCTANDTCYLYKSDGTEYKLLANCGVEIAPDSNDPYYDPVRAPTYNKWAFQVSSSATVRDSW